MKKQLKEKGFNIDKQMSLGLRRAIYVDDTSKRFAISKGKNLKVYKYSDLLGFELNEDGGSVTQGRGLATLAGGLAFGTAGAVVAAMGKRKNTGICTDLSVNIFLNDLQDSNLLVKFIAKPMKKKGLNYQAVQKQSMELITLLTYIDNQN